MFGFVCDDHLSPNPYVSHSRSLTDPIKFLCPSYFHVAKAMFHFLCPLVGDGTQYLAYQGSPTEPIILILCTNLFSTFQLSSVQLLIFFFFHPFCSKTAFTDPSFSLCSLPGLVYHHLLWDTPLFSALPLFPSNVSRCIHGTSQASFVAY